MGLDDVAERMRRAVEALDQLAKAVAAHDRLPSELVTMAEAVSTARRELYRGLMSAGWSPPHGTEHDMALDELLLQHGLGSGYDQSGGDP